MKFTVVVALLFPLAALASWPDEPEAPGCYRLLGERVEAEGTQTFTANISVVSPDWLADHLVGKEGKIMAVYPAAAYLDGAFAAVRAQPAKAGQHSIVLSEVEITSGLPLLQGRNGNPPKAVSIKTAVTKTPLGFAFSVTGRGENMKGKAELGMPATTIGGQAAAAFQSQRPFHVLPASDLYTELKKRGLPYGEKFRLLKNIKVQGDTAVAEIVPHPSLDFSQHVLHPVITDNALHVVAAIMVTNHAGWTVPPEFENAVALPMGFDRVELNAARATQAKGVFTCEAKITAFKVAETGVAEGDKHKVTAKYDLTLRNTEGEVVLTIVGGRLQFR